MADRKVILCVDDEKMVLDSLRAQLLRLFGKRYDLVFAESAEEAIEIIQELDESDDQLYAVISDWLMPEMKGDELLIRVHEGHADTRKILLTGHADQQAVIKASDSQALDCLIQKPWSDSDLMRGLVA